MRHKAPRHKAPRTGIKVFESSDELFNYAFFDWRAEKEKYGEVAKNFFRRSEGNTSFMGNSKKVLQKYLTHDVTHEASLLHNIVNTISTLDFTSASWEYIGKLIEGDDVEVDRYLDGFERCWGGVRKSHKHRKTIRIYINVGGKSLLTKEELAVPGAIAVTLCESLESQGIGTEIWAGSIAELLTTEGDNIMWLCRVKNADEFSDLGMLNYITGDDHVFRNAIFRTFIRAATEELKASDVLSGLGTHKNITYEIVRSIDDGKCDGTIVIPAIYSIEQAKDVIINELKTLSSNGGVM